MTEIGKGMKPTLDPTRAVPVGNEFIGQRFYNEKFMYWGFVRPPQDNWGKTTRLVMMREKVPAPDRAEGPRGRDDGSVYLLKGHFSGEIAYEPKSDLMLDVFVLEGYELISEKNPPPDREYAPVGRRPHVLQQQRRTHLTPRHQAGPAPARRLVHALKKSRALTPRR
ncbi:hypothetical protein QQ056_14110 [Oscillatoria laete-virens NRMC-F 0139]|nr:hypothetical protein [Oscillatoria laete-virens NRMC-F 0139]